MEAFIFGMTPRELLEAGILSFAALYIIRNAFTSMQRNDEMSDKSNAALLKLLSDILQRFPQTLDDLQKVVKSLQETVTSLTSAITSLVEGFNQKYNNLERDLALLRTTVEEQNIKLSNLILLFNKQEPLGADELEPNSD